MQLQNGGPARPRETYRLSLLFGGNNASIIGFPDLLRDAQPGTEKNELSSAQGFRNGCFIPHIFDKNNTALFLWPMISVLGHRSEGTNTGLGPFRPFRAAKANTAIFKLPGECGGISRSIKNYPKDTSPKDTSRPLQRI